MGDYSLILTTQGLAKIASAIANSAQINLTQIALGDGNGITPTPDASQTALVHEVKRINISSKTVNSQNTNQIIIEGYIPAADSGYQIREIGIFDNTGTLIAVGKHPFVDKLNATSGAVVDLYIKQYLTVTNSAVFTIEVDSTAMFVLKSGDSMTGNLIIPAGTALGHAVNKSQLDGKQATITGGASTVTSSNLTANSVLVSDSNGKISANTLVSNTELTYLDGVTSNIQTQINSKQATITGGASTVTSSNLTANSVLVSDSNGKISANTLVSNTELTYLDGVTSNIQTQIDAKANKTGNSSQIFDAANGTTGNQVVNISQFANSLSGNGYHKFPSGLIIQWGNGAYSTPIDISFPIAFPNNCFGVFTTTVIPSASSNADYDYQVLSTTRYGATFHRQNFNDTNVSTQCSCNWFAIGN